MTGRTAGRVAVGLTAFCLAGLPAGLAFASGNPDGSDPGPGLGIGATVLIFVVVPAGLFLLITGLVLLPGLLRRPRYRPGRSWSYDPVWFAGPAEPEAAIRSAAPSAQSRGGAGADW